MSILDFALNMEKDGEAFYRRLAQESQQAGIRAIFTFLADAEARHYRIVLGMKQNEAAVDAGPSTVDDAENIFAEMKSMTAADLIGSGSTDAHVQLYREAQKLEKTSMAFYTEKADEAQNAPRRELLLKLAEEEKRHCWVMGNLVEHVGRPDHGWIEFAEWQHSDEY